MQDTPSNGAPAGPARPSRARLVLFSLVPAAVLFGGLELALRIAGFEFHGIPLHLQFGVNVGKDLRRNVAEPDPELFWRLRVADKTKRFLVRRKHVHPDLAALTGADTRDPKALRVVAMGDSCTFFGSPPYPEGLERALRSRGLDAEVFSASVPGYSSYQGRRWFDLEIAGYDADWITVYYGWNDHWLGMRSTDAELGREGQAMAGFLERVSAHVRLLQAGRYLWTRLASSPSEQRPLRVPLDDYRANLEYLCRCIGETGARAVLITAPSQLDRADEERLRRTGYASPGTDVGALHRAYNRVVREVAEECGADLLDFARAAEARGGIVSEDGIHLTEAGSVWLAGALAERIAGVEETP